MIYKRKERKSMFFDSPIYSTNYSLLKDKVSVHGDTQIITDLLQTIKNQCINRMNLYEAQEMIKIHCVNTYGLEFYEKNVEAITFLIEDEYCDLERRQNPFFDKHDYTMENAMF